MSDHFISRKAESDLRCAYLARAVYIRATTIPSDRRVVPPFRRAIRSSADLQQRG